MKGQPSIGNRWLGICSSIQLHTHTHAHTPSEEPGITQHLSEATIRLRVTLVRIQMVAERRRRQVSRTHFALHLFTWLQFTWR